MCVMVGVVGAALVAAGAIPLARFYHTPELVPVVMAQGLSLIISSFKTVPLALMRRNLQLKAAAFNDMITLVVLSIVTTVLAIMGFGYWTLVVGSLSSALISTVLAFWRMPHRFAWPKRREISDVAKIGSHIVVQRLTWYFYSQADLFITAKIFGKVGAGMYSFASTAVNSPIQKVTALVPKVTSPSFAANQNNRDQLRRLFLLATEGLSLLTFPAAIGLAAITPVLILVLLKPAWEPMTVPMQILALSAGFRSVSPLIGSLLNTIGHSEVQMKNGLRMALFMPVAFLIGSQWGLAGVAAGWLIALPISQVIQYRITLRLLELPGRTYLSALLPAAASSIIMGIGVVAIDRALGGVRPWARLTIEVASGAAIYAICFLTLFRPRTLKVINGIRQALGQAKAQPKGATRPLDQAAMAEPADG